MGFFDDIFKKAQGGSRGSEDVQKPQPQPIRQPQPSADMQSQGSQVPGAEPAVKEIRTYKRDGTNIIEEYECLNADGTVTKTISIGDMREGLKKYEVYKMDKSGIVRRVDSSRQEDAIPTGVVRDMWFEELQRMRDMTQNRDKLGGEHEYTDAPLSYQYADDNRQGNRPYKPEESPSMYTQTKQYADSLGPERRAAIFNDYKDKLLAYGTSRLQNILMKKLDSKGVDLDLSDDQKAQLVDYGNKKLRSLLDKSVDEDRFFNEVWPRYESTKKSENNDQEPVSKPVSFVLDPNNASKPIEESKTKPVSFVIRPELETKRHLDKMFNESLEYVPKNHNRTEKEPLNDRRINTTSQASRDDESVKEKVSIDDTLSNLRKQLKRIVKEDDTGDKLDKMMRVDYIDDVVDKLKRKLRDIGPPKEEPDYIKPIKSEKVKSNDCKPHKFEVTDYFDSDEIFDYGLKALKKLWKKSDTDAQINEELNKLEPKSRSIPMRQYSLNRSDLAKEQQRRLRLEDPVDIDPKKENRYSLKDSPQQKKSDSRWDSNEMALPFQRKQSKPSVEKPERNEIDFETFMKRVRSTLLGQKESVPSREKSRIEEQYSQQPEQEELLPWEKTAKKREVKETVFDLNQVVDNMKHYIKMNSSPKENQSRNEDYNDQDRKVISNKPSFDTTKAKDPVDYEMQSLLSKVRNKLYQTSNREPETSTYNPKPTKCSSPYSYYKPPHAVTTISSRKPEVNQNSQNTISFQIRPKDYSQSGEKSDPFTKQHINYEKSNTEDDDDFAPWWFNNIPLTTSTSSSFVKEPLIPKQPVTNLSGGFSFGGALGGNQSKPQITGF